MYAKIRHKFFYKDIFYVIFTPFTDNRMERIGRNC